MHAYLLPRRVYSVQMLLDLEDEEEAELPTTGVNPADASMNTRRLQRGAAHSSDRPVNTNAGDAYGQRSLQGTTVVRFISLLSFPVARDVRRVSA